MLRPASARGIPPAVHPTTPAGVAPAGRGGSTRGRVLLHDDGPARPADRVIEVRLIGVDEDQVAHGEHGRAIPRAHLHVALDADRALDDARGVARRLPTSTRRE